MVYGYGSDDEVDALLNNFDFYFLPVMNPDGYAYSHVRMIYIFLLNLR